MTEATILRKLEALKQDEAIHLAPGTLKAYRSYWASFKRWCADNDTSPLPASEVAVIGYMMDRYDAGFSLSGLKGARNAIAWQHDRAGHPTPTKSETVKTTMSLLRRKAGKQGRKVARQAVGVRVEHIRMYEDTSRPSPEEVEAGARWTAANERKREWTLALLYTMHNALLRRGEAAALRWSDVRFRPNGRARITIRKSKTSDTPTYRMVTSRTAKYLKALRPRGWKPEDRVFGVTSGRAIRDRIVVAMKGIRPGATGHSLRVGGAQDLTIQGASLQQVKEAGGWATLDMPAYYASKVRPEVGAVNLLEGL